MQRHNYQNIFQTNAWRDVGYSLMKNRRWSPANREDSEGTQGVAAALVTVRSVDSSRSHSPCRNFIAQPAWGPAALGKRTPVLVTGCLLLTSLYQGTEPGSGQAALWGDFCQAHPSPGAPDMFNTQGAASLPLGRPLAMKFLRGCDLGWQSLSSTRPQLPSGGCRRAAPHCWAHLGLSPRQRPHPPAPG